MKSQLIARGILGVATLFVATAMAFGQSAKELAADLIVEHGKVIDGFANSELQSNMDKLHTYLGV